MNQPKYKKKKIKKMRRIRSRVHIDMESLNTFWNLNGLKKNMVLPLT